MFSEGGVDSSNNPLFRGELGIELTDGSRSHLFRHASEITRETKGGYLQGRIKIPSSPDVQFLRLSLVPLFMEEEANAFHLHPNLLHINMKTNKKNRQLMDGELPDDVDWSFIFHVENGSVYRVCPSESPDLREPRFRLNPPKVPQDAPEDPAAVAYEDRLKKGYWRRLSKYRKLEQPLNLGELKLPRSNRRVELTTVKNGYIDMGNTGLMLNIITPLQKFSKGGTTISDVLRQRFQDLFDGSELTPGTLAQVEDFYTKKKEDRIRLQQVCLLVEVFSPVSQDIPRFPFLTSAVSEVITNSKSKECGPLQLYDVNPAVSCCQGQTKIFMLSFFKLVPGVKANFIIFDKQENRIMNNDLYDLFKKINQPSDCTVFNQCVIKFTAPKQDINVIRQIYSMGYCLKVSAFRPSDRKMSSKSFEFRYQPHLGEHCVFCAFLCTVNKVEQLPVAKPGVQRRVNDLVEGRMWDKEHKDGVDTKLASSSVHDHFEPSHSPDEIADDASPPLALKQEPLDSGAAAMHDIDEEEEEISVQPPPALTNMNSSKKRTPPPPYPGANDTAAASNNSSSKRPRFGVEDGDDEEEDYDAPLSTAPKLTPPPPAMRFMGGTRKQQQEQMKPVRLQPRPPPPSDTAMNFYRPAGSDEEEEEEELLRGWEADSGEHASGVQGRLFGDANWIPLDEDDDE